ncbi:hypothetical protein Tco_1367407, partial [Tanacetum coccineum]
MLRRNPMMRLQRNADSATETLFTCNLPCMSIQDDHVEQIKGGKPKKIASNVVASDGVKGSNVESLIMCNRKGTANTNTHEDLYDPVGNRVDVVVPMESIRHISDCFMNTAYGFFLGKWVAYPVSIDLKTNTPYPSRRYGISVPALTKDYKRNEVNTPYPEDSIRRIQEKEYNILEDIKRGPYSKKSPIR